MNANRDTSRWVWAATASLLAAGVGGNEIAFACALALSVAQIFLYRPREGSWLAFPVQVRAAYTALLCVAILDQSRLLAMAMLIATSVRVLLSYCLLARILSLLPGNRAEPLSLALAWRAFLAPTVPGSLPPGQPGRRNAARPAYVSDTAPR